MREESARTNMDTEVDYNSIVTDVQVNEEDDLDLLERLRRWRTRHPRKRRRGRNWHCRECNQKFASKKLVLQHRRDVHDDETDENYTCLNDVYRCKLCSVAASSKIEIENHLLTHSDSHVCTICGQSFPSSYRYLHHLKTHTSGDQTSCPLCDVKTSTPQGLMQHINSSHLKNFPYYCMECDKGFYYKLRFEEHENFHRFGSKFTCVVCNAKFQYSRSLLLHQTNLHTVWISGEVKNRCTICKVRFVKDGTLQNHMRVKHGGLKPHLCDNCGKSFKDKTKLRLHYRIHTGEKPFACGYCEKSFSKKDYLVLHVRTHTGEKPHSCEYCGKSFSQPSTLRIHVRSHTGDKPYVCHRCSAAFPVRASLTAHYKSCAKK